MRSRIQAPYLQPSGGPLYWRNEQSGILTGIVNAYFASLEGEGPRLSVEQFEILKDWMRYWIDAPIWRGSRTKKWLDLRRRLDEAPDEWAIWSVLQEFTDVFGIDPF